MRCTCSLRTSEINTGHTYVIAPDEPCDWLLLSYIIGNFLIGKCVKGHIVYRSDFFFICLPEKSTSDDPNMR